MPTLSCDVTSGYPLQPWCYPSDPCSSSLSADLLCCVLCAGAPGGQRFRQQDESGYCSCGAHLQLCGALLLRQRCHGHRHPPQVRYFQLPVPSHAEQYRDYIFLITMGSSFVERHTGRLCTWHLCTSLRQLNCSDGIDGFRSRLLHLVSGYAVFQRSPLRRCHL